MKKLICVFLIAFVFSFGFANVIPEYLTTQTIPIVAEIPISLNSEADIAAGCIEARATDGGKISVYIDGEHIGDYDVVYICSG